MPLQLVCSPDSDVKLKRCISGIMPIGSAHTDALMLTQYVNSMSELQITAAIGRDQVSDQAQL